MKCFFIIIIIILFYFIYDNINYVTFFIEVKTTLFPEVVTTTADNLHHGYDNIGNIGQFNVISFSYSK